MKQKRMLALFMVALLFMPLLFGIVLANPDKPRLAVPFDELPDDIKIILEERASPCALELIKIGRPPNLEMANAGIGREKFVGDIYPVYHEHGAVYIFRGDGAVIFGDNNVSSVSGLKPGEISIMEVWSAEESKRLFGERSPPPPEPPIVIEPDPGHISNTVGETRTFSISHEDTTFTTVYWIMTDMQEVMGWHDPNLVDFQNHPGLIKQDVNGRSSQIALLATTAGEFVVIAAFEDGGHMQVILWSWEIKPPSALSQTLYFGAIVGIVGLLLLTAWLMRRKK